MIRFRTATTSDAENIATLVNSGYRGEDSKKGWTTEADLLGGQRTDSEWVHDAVLEKQSRIELALSDNPHATGLMKIVACVHLKKESEETCYLGLLTVDPEKQALGLGKKMLEHAEKTAVSWGCKKMRMTVIEQRPELIAYYERRGYQRSGKKEAFPEDHKKFGLPKIEGLVLAEFVKTLCVK